MWTQVTHYAQWLLTLPTLTYFPSESASKWKEKIEYYHDCEDGMLIENARCGWVLSEVCRLKPMYLLKTTNTFWDSKES